MLLGEYFHNIDAKGRIILPSKFRSELGERFIVTKGFDGCLYGYSLEEWKGIESYDPMRYMDITDEFLKTLIHKGKALECNTAGIKYGLGFTHPHELVLKRYLELGGELLTVGSDGHKPEHIFYDFKTTGEFLKNIGFKYYAIYRRHRPEFIRL